jgi:hypothetical protein
MQLSSVACIFIVLVVGATSLKLIQSTKFRLESRPQARELIRAESVAALGPAMSSLVLTVPTVTNAVDGGSASAVTVPLIVSGLVMVPFLYYQQALRPQKKTIEITTTSKPVKPQKKSGGLFGKKKVPEPEPEPEPKKKTNKFLEKLQRSQKSGF